MEDVDGLAEQKEQAPEQEKPVPRKKKILKRDIMRAALERKEKAAETDEDFESIVSDWDRLDSNRERRERYHERRRANVLLDLEPPTQLNDEKRVSRPMRVNHERIIIPTPFTHIWWRQMLSGKNLDLIYNCPIQLEHMTSNHQAYGLLEYLDLKKPYPKEVFFFLAIMLLSTKTLGEMRKQTDRYMRKIYRGMIDEMRYELFFYLYCKYKKSLPLTNTETEYVLAGIELYKDRREMDWKTNEEDAADDGGAAKGAEADDGKSCTLDPGYNQKRNKYYKNYCADPDEDDDAQSDEEKKKNADYFKDYDELFNEIYYKEEEDADSDVDDGGGADDGADEDYDYDDDFYEEYEKEFDEDGNPLDEWDDEV